MRKVKITDYQIGITLGVGTFGRVRIAKSKLNQKHYAIKIQKKSDIIKSKQIDHIQSQSQILSSISHPFIVAMQGFAQDQLYLFFVLEYIPGGELLTHLRNVVRLQERQAAYYAAQVVLIFEHLHNENIVYRDLKPENLLIAQDGYLKLTDFSFAKVVQSKTYTLCGTPQYLAPEILLNQGHGKGVDWWTLGILIYEMNAGIDPFTDEDPMIIYQNILKGKVRFPKQFSKNAKSLIKHLLTAEVSKRYGMLKSGAEDVKKHPYLSEINMKDLLAKKIPMAHRPKLQFPGDTSNFNSYPDSESNVQQMKAGDDPFLSW